MKAQTKMHALIRADVPAAIRTAAGLLASYALCGLLYAAVAHAEVIELEGTIKAIDADARTVTIERKTPKGVKTLDLEVNKKAGDLSAVKVGDTISFSYDPDLEIVTKLGSQKDAAKQNDGWCRFRLAVSDTGEATVAITPIEPTVGAQASKKESLGAGVWRVTRYFSKAQDVKFFESPLGTPVHASLDAAKRCIVLEPKKKDGFQHPASQLVYPLRIRVPFELEIDLSTNAKEGWPCLQVYAGPRSGEMERPVFTLRTKSALKDDASFDAWSSPAGVKQGTFMVERTEFKTNERWDKQFRLPIPNVKSDDFYTLTIGSMGPVGEKTFIQRLSVQGVLVPVLGLSFANKGDVLFVKDLLPGTVAAKAGVQAGDVILKIAGRTPTSAVDAVEAIARTGFGDTCDVLVKRGDEEITLSMKPELAD